MSLNQLPPVDPWVSMRLMQRAMVFLNTNGIDGKALFEEVGLQPDQLADGDAKVGLHVVEALLVAFQAKYPDPFVGLRLAEDVQPSTLGSLGFLMQSCATLADLLHVVVRFNGLMSNIGCISVHQAPGEFEVRWDCLAGSTELRRHLCEYIMGISFVVGALLLPGTPHPRAVRFQHVGPTDPVLMKAYTDFFPCPIHFSQPYTSITMLVGVLQMQLPHGDAALRALLERHTQFMLERRKAPKPSLADEVGRLLEALVLQGQPTKEAIARQLGLSSRSLHRKLEEAGTSYRELLDAVRLKMAQVQLAGSQTPIADLADRLGFSSPQAFMRWFRLRCDLTPGQYRREAGAVTASANP
jgi:AraC-like DNA-binding protein